MSTHRSLVGFVFLAVGGACAMAGTVGGPCAQDSMSNYIKNTSGGPGTGCTVGPLQYTNFFFQTQSTAPPPNGPTGAEGLQVIPDGNLGFNFTGFNPVSSPGTNMTYLIGFDILTDPAPILTGDSISMDPPTGNVSLSLFVCTSDTPYFIGFNPNEPSNPNLACGNQPTAGQSTGFSDLLQPALTIVNQNNVDETGFFKLNSDGVSQYGVLLALTLSDDTTASVGGIGNTPVLAGGVPEPASWLLLGGGLLGMLALRKRLS